MLSSRVRVVRRHWRVALVGVLLTVGLTAAAAVLVPATYTATTELVLIPPHVTAQAGQAQVSANPYLGLAGLQSMADIVARAMMDDDTATSLQKAGVGTYTVKYDALSAGPILLVTVDARSPAQATGGLVTVTDQVTRTLGRLQSATAISSTYFITATVISRPSAAMRSGKAQLRAVGAAFAVGLVLTMLAVAAADGWAAHRGGEREAAAAGAAGDHDAGSSEVPVDSATAGEPPEPGEPSEPSEPAEPPAVAEPSAPAEPPAPAPVDVPRDASRQDDRPAAVPTAPTRTSSWSGTPRGGGLSDDGPEFRAVAELLNRRSGTSAPGPAAGGVNGVNGANGSTASTGAAKPAPEPAAQKPAQASAETSGAGDPTKR